MLRRGGLLTLIWVAVGVWVASTHDYLDNLERTKQLASAILAILLWPLVLLGVSLRIK